MVELIISYVGGYLASYLQGDHGKSLSKNTRFFIAVCGSLVIGFLTVVAEVLNTGTYDPDNFLGYVGVAFIASQARFNLLKEKI